MTVTASTLVTRFPEFGNLETAVVTATIAEALRQCDADVWGDKHDDAVNFLTAHMLALRTQAIGQQIGAVSSGPSTGDGFMATNYGYVYQLMQQGLSSTTGFVF
jgi:hypothetical protein